MWSCFQEKKGSSTAYQLLNTFHLLSHFQLGSWDGAKKQGTRLAGSDQAGQWVCEPLAICNFSFESIGKVNFHMKKTRLAN